MSFTFIKTLVSFIILTIFQFSATANDSAPQINAVEVQVIKAVKFGNSLEQKLWDNKDDFTSRDQVFKHYRQGFSEAIATRMTDHTWSDTLLRDQVCF